ncbi:MAG: hypothetical protein K6E20_01850 [Acholeplasmatales bacterium]|nr:hypothetical protein [Acholeplasmatales bacterium]
METETKKKKAPAKTKAKVPEPVEKEGLLAPKKLVILISIVERNKADFYMSALEGYDVNMQTMFYAKGTAPTEMRRYFGIVDNGKAVIVSIVQQDRVKEILNAYEDKYFKTKNGKGIAFTVPIDSLIGVMVYQFLANIESEV